MLGPRTLRQAPVLAGSLAGLADRSRAAAPRHATTENEWVLEAVGLLRGGKAGREREAC